MSKEVGLTLEDKDRLEAVSQFSQKVAHDLANLLGVIRGCVDLMELKLGRVHGSENPVEKQLALMQRTLDRTEKLVGTVRSFSKVHGHEAESAVQALLTQALQVLNTNTMGGVSISYEGNSESRVRLHSNDLTRILANIVANAEEALKPIADGTILILLEDIIQSEPLPHLDLPAGKFVRISVVDHGVGMSEELKERAIAPFFTTKSTGIGQHFGLGLSIAAALTHQVGGSLSLDSRKDVGTRVHIYLPVAAEG
jgi:signal transduction histidine kinase